MSRVDKLLWSDGMLSDVTILFEFELSASCEAHCCAPMRRPPTRFERKTDDPDMPGYEQCRRCDKARAAHLGSRLACAEPAVTGGVKATFIIGITDTDEVLVRNARDPRAAPWRHADMFLPIAVEVGRLMIATNSNSNETKESDHGKER